MADEKLARIPFSRREEHMIISMSKWMKLFGMFMMAVGVLAFGGVITGVVLLQSARQILEVEPMGIAVLVGVELLLAIWFFQGLALFRAGRKFDLVGRTDEADQKYVSLGFRFLKVFFVIELLFGLLGLLYSLGSLWMAD
jgi:hypothetical protein